MRRFSSLPSNPMWTFTKSPYQVLGIQPSATKQDIKTQFINVLLSQHFKSKGKLSMKYHPDKQSKSLIKKEQLEMHSKYLMIKSAYEFLSDVLSKREYDRTSLINASSNTHFVMHSDYRQTSYNEPLQVCAAIHDPVNP